jgi:imidazolonepropionase-like amidohydrolase
MLRSLLLSVLLGTVVALPAPAQTAPPDSALVLTNARLVDPESRTVRPGTLVIRGDTIAAVRDGVPSGVRGRILDLKGQWVLPGLHDLHVHAYGNMGPTPRSMQYFGPIGTARRMLYAGVRGILDLGNAETPILRDREQTRTYPPAATLYAAGPVFTAPNGHGTEYGVPGMARTVSSPHDARRQVDTLATQRPDVVKVIYNPSSTQYPSMDRATMEAVLNAARAHDLTTVAHVESWAGAWATIRAGVSAITHTPPGPVPDSLVAAMQEHSTVWIPTLAVHTGMAHWMERPRAVSDSLRSAVVGANVLQSYRDTAAYSAGIRAWAQSMAEERDAVLQAVRTLIDAGVPVLAGTDAGNPGVFQGASLHRELELLVEAGSSEWDALAAATTRAGSFLGTDVGLEPGDRASLVVLTASPLQDIRHTRAIAYVIHRGQIVDRSALLESRP